MGMQQGKAGLPKSKDTCRNSNETATEKAGGEHYGIIRYGEERGLVLG